MNKPYSESCEQNKEPILSVISPLLASVSSVLEIGSGTGQHAIYFSKMMPHLSWHTSDCRPYLEGINAWISEASHKNVMPPFELDVSASKWPNAKYDAIFTANSLHIMNKQNADDLIEGAAAILNKGGSLIIYGPFNYNGSFSSESNKQFNQWLKDRDAQSGIKHFEDIALLALGNNMQLVTDYEMPANNRILHFIKN